jgi:hypothetical protein
MKYQTSRIYFIPLYFVPETSKYSYEMCSQIPALRARDKVSHRILSYSSVNFNFSFFRQKERSQIIPILIAGCALGIYFALYLIMSIIVLIVPP